jgi:hypothetical protein
MAEGMNQARSQLSDPNNMMKVANAVNVAQKATTEFTK